MKLSRTTSTILLPAIVLVAALGVGLIIRQARLGNGTQIQAPRDPVPVRTAQPTAEQRALVKEAREKKLAESRNATPEQKEQFKQDLANRISPDQPRDPNQTAARPGRPRPTLSTQRLPRTQTTATPAADANSAAPAGSASPAPQKGTGDTPARDANHP